MLVGFQELGLRSGRSRQSEHVQRWKVRMTICEVTVEQPTGYLNDIKRVIDVTLQ